VINPDSLRVIHPSAPDFVALKSEISASADESHRLDNSECQHWNLHFSNNLFMVYDFPAPISPAVKTNHVDSLCEMLASADESHRIDIIECQHWNLLSNDLFMVYYLPALISPAAKTVGYYIYRHRHSCQ